MHEVLVAAVGLTPQVVTETLWALHHRHPSIRISEIHVLTTEPGKRLCLTQLLDPRRGQFDRFCREFGIPKGTIRFDSSTVRTLHGPDGRPLEDIRTDADSLAIGEQFAALIKSMTERKDIRLHCSIAGGRKTMGILLAQALQLYGRAGDRLYHVLVSPPFETHPDFFYIPKRARWINHPGGRRLNTREARIELAEIPFVRLRHQLHHLFGHQQRDFRAMIELAQREIDQTPVLPNLEIDLRRRLVTIGEAKILLPPRQIALYAFFARQPGTIELATLIQRWSEVSALWRRANRTHMTELKAPQDQKDLFPDISRVNKAIETALGNAVLSPYYKILEELGRRRWWGKYGLGVPRDKIRITGGDSTIMSQ